MKKLVAEWVKKAEGDAGAIMYRALALLRSKIRRDGPYRGAKSA